MKTIRLNADVDAEAVRRLKHLIVDEGITFTTWLRRQIDEYVAEKEPKPKRRKGKEA